MDRADYIGVYGGIKIVKSFCADCESFAFVLGGKLACCDKPTEPDPKKYKRESLGVARKLPPLSDRKAMLEAQDYRCFWCEQRFGDTVQVRGREFKLMLAWDHMVPYSYTMSNNVANFVASCRSCNGWKGPMIFQSIEECRAYLRNKWNEETTIAAQAVRIVRYGVSTGA